MNSSAAVPNDLDHLEKWHVQREKHGRQQHAQQDPPGPDAGILPRGSRIRTHAGHQAAGTGSDTASLHRNLAQTTLEEQHALPPARPRTSQKRSNEEAEGLPQPPSKEARTSQGRTLSRQDSYHQRSPPYYSVGSPPPPGTPRVAAHARQVSSPRSRASAPVAPSPDASHSSECVPPGELPFIKQPATRPISEQQLINEVKGIYAGLVMVEKKCVEIVTQQSQSTKRLENQQWKALVALHRTLLQEHHDFFSASQHPTASDALKRLAIKYAMPARMWRHGIHAFLELLRHRLPDSMEHMLSFIYLSYSMIALLKESVPSFVETWIECLGDLARYRMAIEDSDPRDRETWSNVARMWYNEAADKSPTVGRIQHHLAVLARPHIVEQLFFYDKALTSVVPFVNARESIMLLFDMFVKNNEAMQSRYPLTEAAFVHLSAILFTRGSIAHFYAVRDQFAHSLSAHIDRSGAKLKLQGPQVAMALFAPLFDFGKDDNGLGTRHQTHADGLAAWKQKVVDAHEYSVELELDTKANIQQAEFAALTLDSPVERVARPPAPAHDRPIRSADEVVALGGIIFQDAVSTFASRIGDKNVTAFMHAILAGLWGLSFIPGALVFIEANVPWPMIATYLNTVGRSGVSYRNIEASTFPPSFGGFGRQLPEDFWLRGFVTTAHYYPPDFWTGPLVDEDERLVELPSHQAPRAERCLWLGVRLSTLHRYLTYDVDNKQFACTPLAESFGLP